MGCLDSWALSLISWDPNTFPFHVASTYDLPCGVDGLLTRWFNMRGDPKTTIIYLYKNCEFILTCLNFSHLQSTLHLRQYTTKTFFYCSNHFLNSSILMAFCASAVLLFHLFHMISSWWHDINMMTSAKCFPLWTFSSRETKKKSCSGWDWVNREGGAWGSCSFWSKSAGHSAKYRYVCL